MTEETIFCKAHPTEKLEFFCAEHRALLCAECRQDEKSLHRRCATVPLAEADVTKVRDEDIPRAAERLQKQVQELCEGDVLLKALTARQDKFDASVAAARDQIQAAFTGLRAALDQRERELLLQLEEISAKAQYEAHANRLRDLDGATALLATATATSSGSSSDGPLELVRRAEALEAAAADLESAKGAALRSALTSSGVAFTCDVAGLSAAIGSAGKLASAEKLSVGNFRKAGLQDNEIRLCWDYDAAACEGVLAEAPTFVVDAKPSDAAPQAYAPRYAGAACTCAIPGLAAGASYDFRLGVRLGGVAGGALGTAREGNTVLRIAPRGLLYCGGALGACACGECAGPCGQDDRGCQCRRCSSMQAVYTMSIAKRCPNGHALAKTTFGELKEDRRRLVCAVCRKDILKATFVGGIPLDAPSLGSLYHDYIDFYDTQRMLACEECLYFVCPACVPRVAPLSESPVLGAVENADAFKPVTGVQKWYRDVGAIYCGRKMDQCRCGGGCDGYCGPDNGCPCNECLEDLRALAEGAHLKCKCAKEYRVVPAAERRSRLFKTVCAECNSAIPTNGWYGGLLVLFCADCKKVVCPKCAKNKIPIKEIPPNVYVYDPRSIKQEPVRYEPEVCV